MNLTLWHANIYYTMYHEFLLPDTMDFRNYDIPVQLEFDENTGTHSITVDITDDICVESTEFFFSELQTDDSAVTLDPQRASITILDDDGM